MRRPQLSPELEISSCLPHPEHPVPGKSISKYFTLVGTVPRIGWQTLRPRDGFNEVAPQPLWKMGTQFGPRGLGSPSSNTT